ncbi:hypothetical protein ACEQ8H_004030 [Pleosporales sp. CAS-2024a]
MSVTSVGNYVMFREPGNGQRPVVAVLCPDDFAPQSVKLNRPFDKYVSLVAMVDMPHRFAWARTSQLSPIPGENADMTTLSIDQQDARDSAAFWRGAAGGLTYWRDVAQALDRNEISSSRSVASRVITISDDEDDDEDEDAEMYLETAKRLSLSLLSSSSASLPTPSCTPPGKRRRIRDQKELGQTYGSDQDEGDDLYPKPEQQSMAILPDRPPLFQPYNNTDLYSQHLFKQAQSTSITSPESEQDLDKSPRRTARQSLHERVSLDPIFGMSGLRKNASAPTSDAIQGDISESREFIRIVVGRDAEEFMLPKEVLWNRVYFRDSMTGTNHFALNEQNIWELRHPQLVNMEAQEFRLVAEYLSGDKFGLREPETPDQEDEAIAQCVAAWDAAEKLDMHDMLDEIAHRVEFLAWEDTCLLVFAKKVYSAQGPVLPAHDTVRNWLSGTLAKRFWALEMDPVMGSQFRKYLRRLPELERDVFVKRGVLLTQGAADEDSD